MKKKNLKTKTRRILESEVIRGGEDQAGFCRIFRDEKRNIWMDRKDPEELHRNPSTARRVPPSKKKKKKILQSKSIGAGIPKDRDDPEKS